MIKLTRHKEGKPSVKLAHRPADPTIVTVKLALLNLQLVQTKVNITRGENCINRKQKKGDNAPIIECGLICPKMKVTDQQN